MVHLLFPTVLTYELNANMSFLCMRVGMKLVFCVFEVVSSAVIAHDNSDFLFLIC